MNGNRCRFGPLAAACAFALAAISSSAGAVTLDELKGYSIEVNVTVNNVWKQSQGRDDPIANDVHSVRKIYVSLAGRIFDYADRWGGATSEHQGSVVAPNAATSTSRQQMIAWTVEDGKLIGIMHEIEGFLVLTITVDLSHMTCGFTAGPRPDPTTGRVVIFKLNGYKSELASMTLRSADCAIRRGNVFSTDQ